MPDIPEWRTPQEDEPPEVVLIAKAAHNLVVIVQDQDRSLGDQIKAVDALGRALLRLKLWLRDQEQEDR